MEIDTFNKHFVGLQAHGIVVINPPRGIMSPDDALVFAAWIVCLADPRGEKFKEVLQAVSNS